MAKPRRKSGSVWTELFSASHPDDLDTSPLSVQSGGVASSTPGSGSSSMLDGESGGMVDAKEGVKCSPDGNLLIRRMPVNRLEKYATLRAMGKDPTIDSALKMHLSHALASNPETGEIINIDTKDGNDHEHIVEDLRSTFKPILNANLEKWAYGACLMGWQPLRVYGEKGVGITQVRHDYYTLPDFTSRFERVGNLAGFASSWQQLTGHERSKGLLRLMPPWSFVEIKLPNWQLDHFNKEPHRHNGDVFSIDSEDWQSESYIESQDYGTSLIETAFEPWVDLQEAILSLNMSRKNAANVERLIGVQTGKLNPQKAAEYLNTIGNQMRKASQAQAQQSLRKGYVQTVWNHIIPIFSAGQGQLDISTVEGRPDIAEIEDIKFHVNRLGGAVGVEPALLGFGEQMSGGLGDGGFFRMSVMAAMKANMVRTAVEAMIQRLFDIHVAYKYGKVFTEAERPWQVRFHSLNTAIAREQSEEAERQVQFATSVTGLMQMIDPMLGNVKINEFQNWLMTDLMKVDEEKAKRILADVRKVTPGEGEDEGEIIGESVSPAEQDKLNSLVKTLIYEALADMEIAA
ncbi:portal protein [Vreelandella alkaliphila]|uniref:Portal protein n=1 Tax=Vreelandella alkaliphila TaxID=272774 RepID=A0AAJ2S556_9GAMM|nr:portal protein [Halomonas alkaliphila]MDX5979565.1 portal protein [Halomonas alkaliphila]